MPFYISRFVNRKNVKFNVEVVTPMFLGGADKKSAELRAQSIKGLMRFWWRAICDSDDIASMKSSEDEIFGSTTKKASFSITIDAATVKPVLKNLPQGKRFEVKARGRVFRLGIVDYLAFGIRDNRGRYAKEHIPSGQRFVINLDIRNLKFENTILQAFQALVEYGGIGAKSRNGFGSVYVANLQPLRLKFDGDLKKFSAISKKTLLFDNFQEHDQWQDALSEIGLTYRKARLSLDGKGHYERRLLIAKPIVQARNGGGRHPKPYFLKVKKLKNGKYKGQILFMPYMYHEKEKYCEACNKMNTKIQELMGR